MFGNGIARGELPSRSRMPAPPIGTSNSTSQKKARRRFRVLLVASPLTIAICILVKHAAFASTTSDSAVVSPPTSSPVAAVSTSRQPGSLSVVALPLKQRQQCSSSYLGVPQAVIARCQAIGATSVTAIIKIPNPSNNKTVVIYCNVFFITSAWKINFQSL